MARAPMLQEVEPVPEADRLGEFPHPRETSRLFGQDAGERLLGGAFASGRMHHAWILAGREGIGKATLAYRLARYVLARPEDRTAPRGSLEISADSPTARQVRALSHPGLLVIRRPYDTKGKRFVTTIPVDEVRRLKSFLTHTAGAQAWRVVIVDRADDLNPNAANALLKSLEEPPPQTVFLLVAAEPGRLLVTIRSRCRVVDLPGLPPDALQRAAEQALAAASLDGPSAEAFPRLRTLAEGSVRRLLVLAASDGVEVAGTVDRIFGTLPRIDWAAAHALADSLAATTEQARFETFFDLLLGAIARLARSAAIGGEVGPAGAPAVPNGKLLAWAELWQEIMDRKAETLALNLDRRALILGVLARLEAVSR
jgi:DNA polymerase-3 subunit delta'